MGTANPVGSDGPVVTGSPIGPCETLSPLFQDALGPLEHSVPAETYDCYPAVPAGPYVAGGPVGPDEKFQVLDPLEHSGPDHADPAGHHAIFREVLEPLEHSVLDTARDGRPMAGFPVLGPIENSVLEITLDGGHSEMTIDEEPLAQSVLDVTLDGRPMEGIPIPEPLEHSVLGGGGGGWTADSWRGCHI